MSTITREWLLKAISQHERMRDEIPFGLDEDDSNTLAALRIALASLEAEAVGIVRHIELRGPEHPAGMHVSLYSRLDDGIELYTAPPEPVIPAELHPDTQKLVTDFCSALAEKLYKAQLKYGYDVDWKQDGWPSQCQAHFQQHIAKGDPRDVAAYCAFMWYHGWKTEPAQVIQETADREMLKRLAVILSGSDAPGEIRSLTVTARSFVERCKTLAKERDECRAAMLQGGKS